MARAPLLLAVACVACGARTPLSLDADAAAPADVAPTGVTLAVPLGAYPSCASSTVTARPNLVGVTGRDGAVTLTREGDQVVAALEFPTYASGRLAFAPTGARTAGLREPQTLAVQTTNPGYAVVPVIATSGALALVGSTLFLSTHGGAGGDDVRTFIQCRVPEGATPSEVTTRAPPAARVAPGVYRSCTAESSTEAPSRTGNAGGLGTLTVATRGDGLALTWSEGLWSELSCRGLDVDGSDVVTGAPACEVRQPCGPPPTLGPSPFPDVATLAGLAGSVTSNGGALFVHLRGDAGARACGVHDLTITCAPE